MALSRFLKPLTTSVRPPVSSVISAVLADASFHILLEGLALIGLYCIIAAAFWWG